MNLLFRNVLKEHRRSAAAYLIYGLSITVLSMVSVYCFQQLLDDFGVGLLSPGLIGLYGALMGMSVIVSYLDNYPSAKLESGLYLSFKLMALSKMRTVCYQDYQKLGTGQLVQKVENGAGAGRDILFHFYFRLIWELIPNVVLSLAFMAAISVEITLAVIAGYVLVFLLTKLLLRYLYSVKEKVLVNEEFLNRRLVRGFMELVVFRVNRRFPAELAAGRREAGEITGAKTRTTMIHEAFFAIFALLIAGVKLGVILFAFLSRRMTVGELVAMLTFLDRAYTPVAIFNVIYVDYKLNRIAFQRYQEIMELPDDPRLLLKTPASGVLQNGAVEFDRVCCSYGEKAVLKEVSLRIPAGTSAALVGESGSGKSTLAKLLAGLLDSDSGAVFVDQVPMSEMPLDDYYEKIAYIPQEAPVFDGTLRENLVFDRAVPDSELFAALEQVALKEFLAGLPQGLSTALGERGVMLSGGERQRLALARLWFSEPKLIILDEATSAMDPITEEIVMANVLNRLKGRTVIAVAHRLKTIAGCDRICVMKSGVLAEQGGFEELLSQKGYFARLWKASQLEEERRQPAAV